MDWWKKKKNNNIVATYEERLILERGAKLLEDLIECCDGKSNPIKFFSKDEIDKATDNFSNSNHIPELLSSDYMWYTGKDENHQMILITKVVGGYHGFKVKNFCRDIAVSSMVSGHKNFLKLIGCCLEPLCPVMVYHVGKKHYILDITEESWKRRMKIAEDIATALAYLHTAFPKPFVYRNMAPKKIILDEDGVAKLIDFSCCVSIPQGETFVHVGRGVGLFRYMEENYKKNGVVSEKTDVFAIGKIIQTFLPEEETEEEGKVDSDCEIVEFSEQEICQMKAFGVLSLRCIGHTGEVPTMVEVAKEVKKIQRTLINDSYSHSDETQFDYAQDFSSSVVLSDQT